MLAINSKTEPRICCIRASDPSLAPEPRIRASISHQNTSHPNTSLEYEGWLVFGPNTRLVFSQCSPPKQRASPFRPPAPVLLCTGSPGMPAVPTRGQRAFVDGCTASSSESAVQGCPGAEVRAALCARSPRRRGRLLVPSRPARPPGHGWSARRRFGPLRAPPRTPSGPLGPANPVGD